MSTQGSSVLLCKILEAIQCLEIDSPTPPDITVDVPVVVVPPCQPCIAVEGVVDPNVTLAYIDGVATYYSPDGEIPADGVEILSPCDPRCGCACTNEDCDCACTPADLSAMVKAVGAGS